MNNNIKIAEFLGFQKTQMGYYDFEECLNDLDLDGNTFDPHELKFHSSWDWLIKAVNKCDKHRLDMTIHNHDVDHKIERMKNSFLEADIISVYNLVLEFIEEHVN